MSTTVGGRPAPAAPARYGRPVADADCTAIAVWSEDYLALRLRRPSHVTGPARPHHAAGAGRGRPRPARARGAGRRHRRRAAHHPRRRLPGRPAAGVVAAGVRRLRARRRRQPRVRRHVRGRCADRGRHPHGGRGHRRRPGHARGEPGRRAAPRHAGHGVRFLPHQRRRARHRPAAGRRLHAHRLRRRRRPPRRRGAGGVLRRPPRAHGQPAPGPPLPVPGHRAADRDRRAARPWARP